TIPVFIGNVTDGILASRIALHTQIDIRHQSPWKLVLGIGFCTEVRGHRFPN
ncbi:unnamed protein product, partial [Allacma fusca]